MIVAGQRLPILIATWPVDSNLPIRTKAGRWGSGDAYADVVDLCGLHFSPA